MSIGMRIVVCCFIISLTLLFESTSRAHECQGNQYFLIPVTNTIEGADKADVAFLVMFCKSVVVERQNAEALLTVSGLVDRFFYEDTLSGISSSKHNRFTEQAVFKIDFKSLSDAEAMQRVLQSGRPHALVLGVILTTEQAISKYFPTSKDRIPYLRAPFSELFSMDLRTAQLVDASTLLDEATELRQSR